MSMTAVKALVNNQNILENFGLAEEIDEQAAEIISGGSENFTIRNTTGRMVICTLDGRDITMQPDQEIHPTAQNGIIEFDMYAGSNTLLMKKSYNLSDGQIYEFKNNYDTANSEDIDLYPVYS